MFVVSKNILKKTKTTCKKVANKLNKNKFVIFQIPKPTAIRKKTEKNRKIKYKKYTKNRKKKKVTKCKNCTKKLKT